MPEATPIALEAHTDNITGTIWNSGARFACIKYAK